MEVVSDPDTGVAVITKVAGQGIRRCPIRHGFPAIDRLGQGHRSQFQAGTNGSTEKVGVADALVMQASLKKLDRGQLRDEVGEGHGITSYLRGMLAKDFSVNQPEDPSPVWMRCQSSFFSFRRIS